MQTTLNMFDYVKSGDLQRLAESIERGAEINYQKNGKTALMMACQQDNLPMVAFLVEHGAFLDIEDNYGKDALFYATAYGYYSIIEYLVEHGSDVNHQDLTGETSLEIATASGMVEIVKYLVDHGAQFLNDALYSAIYHSDMEFEHNYFSIIEYLIEHGADVNYQYRGMTCLMLASGDGKEDIVEYLIEHGADVRLQDHQGKTSIDYARDSGESGIVDYLQRIVDIENAQDEALNTLFERDERGIEPNLRNTILSYYKR